MRTQWKAVPGCAALAVALSIPGTLLGRGRGKKFDPPRLSDGKPDLNGIWNGPAAINNDIQGAKINGKNVIIDPANGKLPYTPEGAAQLKKNAADRKQLDPVNHCFIPGVPRLMSMP